jgi:hypothetical protein
MTRKTSSFDINGNELKTNKTLFSVHYKMPKGKNMKE